MSKSNVRIAVAAVLLASVGALLYFSDSKSKVEAGRVVAVASGQHAPTDISDPATALQGSGAAPESGAPSQWNAPVPSFEKLPEGPFAKWDAEVRALGETDGAKACELFQYSMRCSNLKQITEASEIPQIDAAKSEAQLDGFLEDSIGGALEQAQAICADFQPGYVQQHLRKLKGTMLHLKGKRASTRAALSLSISERDDLERLRVVLVENAVLGETMAASILAGTWPGTDRLLGAGKDADIQRYTWIRVLRTMHMDPRQRNDLKSAESVVSARLDETDLNAANVKARDLALAGGFKESFLPESREIAHSSVTDYCQ